VDVHTIGTPQLDLDDMRTIDSNAEKVQRLRNDLLPSRPTMLFAFLPVKEQRRPLLRSLDGHLFGSILMLDLAAGVFLLVPWVAAKDLFYIL